MANDNVVQLNADVDPQPPKEPIDEGEVLAKVEEVVLWFRERGYEFHAMHVDWQDIDNYVANTLILPYVYPDEAKDGGSSRDGS